MKIIFINLLQLIILTASAQNDYTLNPAPKHKIWVSAIRGDLIRGILVDASDSSVNVFPGKFNEWNSRSKILTVNKSYLNIASIETHKKGGLLKGLLMGAGIGLSPLLLSAAFGKGEGGAYMSIIAFPVGIITGGIIGSTSKNKFFIGGERARFQRFQKCMKY